MSASPVRIQLTSHEQQYQFLQCVKQNDKQKIYIIMVNILCSVPLHIIIPKLTLKSGKRTCQFT